MTVRTDKYENYRKALLDGGAPADQVEAVIADMKADDAKIEALICLKCGAPLVRTLDPRQDGPTEIAGKWFNYRCTAKCGWFADRCEPIGEN
jgi:ribosomal protein L40E